MNSSSLNRKIAANPVIKVASPSFSAKSELRKELLRHFPNALFNDTGKKFSGNDLIHFLQDTEGAVIGLETIDENLIKNCPNLKIIAKYGVGLDNIDLAACKRRKLCVDYTCGVNRRSVAELALGFMISLSRNIARSSTQLKEGVWKRDGGSDISEKTVGIIGVGHIGKDLVRLLKPFNCKILANDIVDQKDFYRKNGCVESTKETIFKKSDFVTIHTPLTEKTRGLVNQSALKKMKGSSFFINTARGPIVNEKDLKKALENGWIAGAAVDVYEEEPPKYREFLRLPNLICTPHIGGNSHQAVMSMGLCAIQHLRKFFSSGKEAKR